MNNLLLTICATTLLVCTFNTCSVVQQSFTGNNSALKLLKKLHPKMSSSKARTLLQPHISTIKNISMIKQGKTIVYMGEISPSNDVIYAEKSGVEIECLRTHSSNRVTLVLDTIYFDILAQAYKQQLKQKSEHKEE